MFIMLVLRAVLLIFFFMFISDEVKPEMLQHAPS